jgi:hypothetical protein
MKKKPKKKPKSKVNEKNIVRELEYKISHLERELVSALEEHSRALIDRNRAEEMSHNMYEALRKILGICRR